MSSHSTTPQTRFWSKVDRHGPIWNGSRCWVWTAGGVGGYGTFRLKEKKVLAHRYAYETLVGPIPEGLTIDHLCRNSPCVRPLHLEPVTMQVNILRGNGWSGRNARKTHCKRGHPFDQTNTYNPPVGSRQCRICIRNMERAWREKQREEKADA